MLAEAAMGFGAFKTMFDLAKAIRDMDDAVKRNAAVYDLWEQITAIQARYTASIEQIDQLKKELTRFETWEVEKDRYELKQLYRGPFAYILKEGQENGEAPHALCTNCFERRFKSILQMGGQSNVHERTWGCPSCKMTVKGQWAEMSDWIRKSREPAV